VGVDDVMGHILWVRSFLLEQGYPFTSVRIYQDNRSAILLENNGKWSSSKRTRHIDIRYFFVTDRIRKKEVEIVHCPTAHMVADYFTKPLQGALFRQHRRLIKNENDQGSNSASKVLPSYRSVLELDANGSATSRGSHEHVSNK
jgi:hypothetical protein